MSPRVETSPAMQRLCMAHAHGLILFNVLGIPLSFGALLEFYYNNFFPTLSLVQIASIPATQIACIFCMGIPAGWLYQHGFSQTATIAASAIAGGCQFSLAFVNSWTLMLVVQGIVLGCALGLLMPLSTLALASHWNNLVPLVSMEATGFAFIGAAVYVTIAAVALQVPAWEAMCFASGGVTIGTLGAAAFLTNKCRGHARHSLQYSSKTLQFTQLPSLLFLAGYVAILFGVFSFPVYIVFLCTNSTGSAWPLQPSSMLIVSLACGVVSAPWSASKRIRDSVGPVNAFVIAATVGGVCFYNPGEMPFTTVSWPVSIIYGLCLGVLLTVHLKAISVFHWMSVPVPYHSDMAIRMAVVAAVGGIAAAGGILVTAILIEEGGFDLGMMVPGTSMLAGGVLVGAARYLRGYKQFFMAL